jgi:hypothetical protein
VPENLASPAPTGSDFFGAYSPAVTCASAVILLLAISVIDRLTGYDLQLGILNLVPIAMVTWGVSRNWGLAIALGAVGLWFGIFHRLHTYGSSFYFFWDGAVLLVTFVGFVLLLSALREARRAHELSAAILEKLDVPAYVVDLQRDVVLFGNRRYRESCEGRPFEELAREPAHEARFALQDGRPVLLRILRL